MAITANSVSTSTGNLTFDFKSSAEVKSVFASVSVDDGPFTSLPCQMSIKRGEHACEIIVVTIPMDDGNVAVQVRLNGHEFATVTDSSGTDYSDWDDFNITY